MAILIECSICHRKHKVSKSLCPCGENLDKAKKAQRARYWIQYRLLDGRQRKEYIGKKISEARDADGKRRVQKREKRIFDIRPDNKMTFRELSDWFMGLETVKALACYRRRLGTLKSFNAVFGDTSISNIKPMDLENYQLKRKNEGRADATIDQETADMLTAVYKAFNNDLIDGEAIKAFNRVKKLLKPRSNARDRILAPEEFERLMAASPKHLQLILATGYHTGMRLGEILSLTWNKVDLKERVIRLEAGDTKDREARAVPVCDRLHKLLKSVPRAIHEDRVFLYGGRPFRDIYGAVATACKKAGIAYGRFTKDGFVFHDLRHTFNTNMRKAGVPESVIMDITGHSTREMFDRYNTVDPGDRQEAIRRFGKYLENVTQDVTQEAKNQD